MFLSSINTVRSFNQEKSDKLLRYIFITTENGISDKL